jgi:hypothetical protein
MRRTGNIGDAEYQAYLVLLDRKLRFGSETDERMYKVIAQRFIRSVARFPDNDARCSTPAAPDQGILADEPVHLDAIKGLR